MRTLSERKVAGQRTRLRVESLEDRTTPSVTIVDDGDAGFSAGAGWEYWLDAEGRPFWSDQHYLSGPGGGGAATWAVAGLEPGTYRVSATWMAYTNRAADAFYTVYDGLGRVVATEPVDQRLGPDDFAADGTPWEVLGDVQLTAGGDLVVTLPGAGDGYLIADAVRFERIDGTSPPPPPPPSPPPPSEFHITLRTSGLTTSQITLFQAAAARWSEIITGDLPNATYQGIAVDDVLIDASATPIDGPGGILGQAGPDRFRSGTSLPIHGIVQFDSADIGTQEANGSLWYTILHEIGHVLGFGTIWQQRGLLSGGGGSNPVFVGAQAMAEYGALIGSGPTAVPVENTGGPGTRNSHWRESVFGHEAMTGYLDSGNNPISRLTVASMADLGYVVNLDAADPYP